MVTKLQLDRLEQRMEQIAEVLEPERAAVRCVVFKGETLQFAMARHLELRPEHRGRRIRLEYRNDARDHLSEMLAACSLDEIQAVLDAISGKLGDHIAKRDA
jgi:hypothetical protein